MKTILHRSEMHVIHSCTEFSPRFICPSHIRNEKVSDVGQTLNSATLSATCGVLRKPKRAEMTTESDKPSEFPPETLAVSLKLFLVDDERQIADVLSLALGEAAFDVETFLQRPFCSPEGTRLPPGHSRQRRCNARDGWNYLGSGFASTQPQLQGHSHVRQPILGRARSFAG